MDVIGQTKAWLCAARARLGRVLWAALALAGRGESGGVGRRRFEGSFALVGFLLGNRNSACVALNDPLAVCLFSGILW